MNIKGFFKGAGKALVNYGPMAIGIAATVVPGGGVAQKAVIPMIGSVINAIAAAREKGGTGQDQFADALRSLQVSAPAMIFQMEQIFGIDIDEDAYEPYIKGQIQLHYDLLKANGKIAPTAK